MIESYAALGTLILGVISLYIGVRRSIRNDKAARLRQAEDDRQKAIAEAERPLRERITELQNANLAALEAQHETWQARIDDLRERLDAVTAERDYYRKRHDDRGDREVSLKKDRDEP